MMRWDTTRFRSILAAAVILVAAVATVRAQPHGSAYELLIEHSPADAGRVTPNSGTHHFSPNATVTLTANPQPGYRFAYWLGDVSDPSAERTTVLVNEPKVVVAVFHPDPRKRPEQELGSAAGGAGGAGMMVATATDLSAPGWSPAGGSQPGKVVMPGPAYYPVVVTPEPTTIALLALGALALRRRRR